MLISVLSQSLCVLSPPPPSLFFLPKSVIAIRSLEIHSQSFVSSPAAYLPYTTAANLPNHPTHMIPSSYYNVDHRHPRYPTHPSSLSASSAPDLTTASKRPALQAFSSDASGGEEKAPSNGDHQGGTGGGAGDQGTSSSSSSSSLIPPAIATAHAPVITGSHDHSTISDPDEPKGKTKKRKSIVSKGGVTTDEVESKGESQAGQMTSEGTGEGRVIGVVRVEAEKEEAEKRNKTSRACDVCRGKKTRCDILPDIEPQICRYCQNVRVWLVCVVLGGDAMGFWGMDLSRGKGKGMCICAWCFAQFSSVLCL